MMAREENRRLWLAEQLGLEEKPGNQLELVSIAGGASFREFFRFQHEGQSYVLMDEPLDELPAFDRYVQLTEQLTKIGLHVPKIYAIEPHQGWAWLEDFGDALLGNVLSSKNVDELYQQAMDALLILQASQLELPIFGREPMAFAMQGFQTYCLEKWLNLSFKAAEQRILNQTYERLIDQALDQPQLPMHRDFHCQNMLRLADGSLGIIDFQDAKIGPVTYDLASYLRDCYVDWPPEQVIGWMGQHYAHLCDRGLLKHVSQDQFRQWFDWMGLERHLKAVFTFVRKYLRDGDDRYMQYLTRTFNYIEQVSEDYSELKGFHELLIAAILPRVMDKIA